VIDLSESNYFSPDMIEQLQSLRDGMPPGGKVVICSPSDDVRMALEHLDIPELPGIYRSAASALSGVTGSPMSGTYFVMRSRTRLISKTLLWIAGMAAVVAAVWLLIWFFTPPQDEQDYRALARLGEELSRLRREDPRSIELRSFADETQEELIEIIKRYRGAADSPIDKELLNAATALNQDLLRQGAGEVGVAFRESMQELRRLFAAASRPVTTP
jgi:hypothetical protein